MNREKFEAVLARGEQPGHSLDMRHFFGEGDEHGHTACLAGHASMLAGWARIPHPQAITNNPWFVAAGVKKDDEVKGVYAVAKDYLELTDAQARVLFLSIHLRDADDVRAVFTRLEEKERVDVSP